MKAQQALERAKTPHFAGKPIIIFPFLYHDAASGYLEIFVAVFKCNEITMRVAILYVSDSCMLYEDKMLFKFNSPSLRLSATSGTQYYYTFLQNRINSSGKDSRVEQE